MNGGPFIAVLPADVECYGPAAAIVFAMIRYRTGTDGPGRLERDGYRWWRVTHRDLATATGLSTKAVRTALRVLDGAVLAKHFPPLANQTLAYRIAVSEDAVTCQLPVGAPADLPVAPAGTPDAAAGTPPRPSGHLYLSLENLEKRGEAAATCRRPPLPPQTPRPLTAKRQHPIRSTTRTTPPRISSLSRHRLPPGRPHRRR